MTLPHDGANPSTCRHPTSRLYLFQDLDDGARLEVRCMCGTVVTDDPEGPAIRWLRLEGAPLYRRHTGAIELAEGEPMEALA